MRAPDLAAIAAHHASLPPISAITTRNAWLHKLLTDLGKLPHDEEVRWSRLLEMVRAAGPPEPPIGYAMGMARDLETYFIARYPTQRMYAYGLVQVIHHVLMTPDKDMDKGWLITEYGEDPHESP